LEPLSLDGTKRPQLVASTSVVADVAANVGGEHVSLSVLIPRGTDPHTYQPTPADLQMLYEADLILLNGFDLEIDLEEVLAPVSQDVPVLSLSEGLPARTLEAQEHADEDQDHEEEHGSSLDPHVWFDPNHVSHWVDQIELALTQIDPQNTISYQENAQKYRKELSSLDDWIQDQVATIPIDQRKLVLDHLVMGYFADRYGFEMLSALVPAFSSAAEASPRELAELGDMIDAEEIQAIFIGVDTNPRLAQQIANDLGISVIEIYTGSLGPTDGPAATYLEMMQYNVLAMMNALSPDESKD
jgi:zinc/manganese transport system substrate-binding protein/manganese/iron transport system substrate-binding protein